MKVSVSVASVFVAASLSGCGTVLPGSAELGSGDYLQIFEGDKVLIERNFSGSGLLHCSAQVAQVLRANPQLKGRIRCVEKASAQALPYSFVAHIQQSPESGEVQRSRPFTTKTATSVLCVNWRETMRKQEKTVIVTDQCAAMQNAKPA